MERRRDERIETNVQLSCRVPARPVRAIMHDLSHSGCRLQFGEASIELGATALVDLPGMRRASGRIVWVEGNLAGVRFDRRIGKADAVKLGLEQPDPEADKEPEPIEEPNVQGLIRHWFRRLFG